MLRAFAPPMRAEKWAARGRTALPVSSLPEELGKTRVIEISLPSLVAGTKYRGEFEERMEAVIREASTAPKPILFIDEIHLLLGAGQAGGSMDAANILKPALARGAIRLIGATTSKEYRQTIDVGGQVSDLNIFHQCWGSGVGFKHFPQCWGSCVGFKHFPQVFSGFPGKWGQCANLDRMQERISKKRVLRPLAEKRVLDTWEKIVNFTRDEWFPSLLSFGKFKGGSIKKHGRMRNCVHGWR